MLKWPPKHHLVPKSYGVDWSKRYPDDPVASAQFTVLSGQIELGEPQRDGSVVKVELSGGQSSAQNRLLGKPANRAVLTCAVTLESGAQDAVDVVVDIL